MSEKFQKGVLFVMLSEAVKLKGPMGLHWSQWSCVEAASSVNILKKNNNKQIKNFWNVGTRKFLLDEQTCMNKFTQSPFQFCFAKPLHQFWMTYHVFHVLCILRVHFPSRAGRMQRYARTAKVFFGTKMVSECLKDSIRKVSSQSFIVFL